MPSLPVEDNYTIDDFYEKFIIYNEHLESLISSNNEESEMNKARLQFLNELEVTKLTRDESKHTTP